MYTHKTNFTHHSYIVFVSDICELSKNKSNNTDIPYNNKVSLVNNMYIAKNENQKRNKRKEIQSGDTPRINISWYLPIIS